MNWRFCVTSNLNVNLNGSYEQQHIQRSANCHKVLLYRQSDDSSMKIILQSGLLSLSVCLSPSSPRWGLTLDPSLHPKWLPIHYIVHYIWPRPHRTPVKSSALLYLGNRGPFGTISMSPHLPLIVWCLSWSRAIYNLSQHGFQHLANANSGFSKINWKVTSIGFDAFPTFQSASFLQLSFRPSKRKRILRLI